MIASLASRFLSALCHLAYTMVGDRVCAVHSLAINAMSLRRTLVNCGRWVWSQECFSASTSTSSIVIEALVSQRCTVGSSFCAFARGKPTEHFLLVILLTSSLGPSTAVGVNGLRPATFFMMPRVLKWASIPNIKCTLRMCPGVVVPISRVLVPVCAFPIIPIRPCISMELLMAWSSFSRTFIKISISSQGLASSIWMISNCELPSNARAISFKKTKATFWGFSHVFRFASSKIPRRTCLFHQKNSLARLNPLERGHHFPCCPSSVLTTGEICRGQTSDMLLSTTRQSLFK